jgi:hypothetical protein
MDSNERKQKYEAHVGEIYRAIGRYCVSFEHLSHTMQTGIILLFQKGGLNNQKLVHIVLAELTSYPLKSILQAMIGELADLSIEEKRICDKIFSKTGKLIEQRNDIIHSTWFVGWANEQDTDFSDAGGYKLSRGKSGAGIKSFEYTAQDFDRFASECEAVAELIGRLWNCVLGDFQVVANFVIGEDGSVSVPPKR